MPDGTSPRAATSSCEALADDFNTPRAMAALFELVAEGNSRPLPGARAGLEETLPIVGLEALLETERDADPEAERPAREARGRPRGARFRSRRRLRDELAERG